MRILVVAAALAATATTAAAADPITAKLGKRKVTLTTCTVDGPALYLGDVWSGVVATPDGALLVLDRDGGVHRYTVAKGDDCRLTPDPTFGKGGVVASGIVAKNDDWASLAMDRAGTIYVDVIRGSVRITGGKVAKMCLDGALAASPRSDHVWRWLLLDRVTRTDATCKATDAIDLSRHSGHKLGEIAAIDDRLVVGAGDDTDVVDATGKVVRTLAGGDPLKIFARAWDACGTGYCAAGEYAFYAWGADGKLLGSFDTQGLSQTDHAWSARGFAMIGGTGWLFGDEYVGTDPARAAIIFRVDGLP